ncbi:hypothetical protein OHA37_37690 [Streptomyces sp. NBC_00335]|uniref:hypothetical protein n=1 Tax=unclassified Streptomyces TaxID=2593676 RepID=UPI002251C743|nr:MULTISPECIES: hypothetical protein [unclassified Streptomyces]MCX5409578.1 hypothetical protein [Streptomyces sp. NBC_00086]
MKKIYEDKSGRGAVSDPVFTAEDLARPTPPPTPPAPPKAAPANGPAGEPTGGTESHRGSQSEEEPFLGDAEAERYHTTWNEIQGRFVDDPREAVRSADVLVSEVMLKFSDTLSARRDGLEKRWNGGEQVATEDLRQALRAYRSLVDRLLAT